MNRRGFLASLAALAVAPKAIKFVAPSTPMSDLELAFIEGIERCMAAIPAPDVVVMHPQAYAKLRIEGLLAWLPEGTTVYADRFCPPDAMFSVQREAG